MSTVTDPIRASRRLGELDTLIRQAREAIADTDEQITESRRALDAGKRHFDRLLAERDDPNTDGWRVQSLVECWLPDVHAGNVAEQGELHMLTNQRADQVARLNGYTSERSAILSAFAWQYRGGLRLAVAS